ncbi:MAG TPA: FHA domain-containing protein [Chloroflexota bacterium]|nr:FHA domain-containing protein [Chloroflexota bacterium]
MDLLDLAILALRLALVGVLYAFLVVVLRAAKSGLQAARPAPAPPVGVELRLIVLEPGGSGLTAGQALAASDGATLGRAEPADLKLADATVSARHAQVSRRGQEWLVRDLGSTNGTLVNDAQVIGSRQLRHGDVLAVGGVRFTVALTAASRSER